jgi:hypothetical protein
MVIPDFLTKIAKSRSSSAMGILVLFFHSLIIFEAVPVDIPNSLAIWSLDLPLRYHCITRDVM